MLPSQDSGKSEGLSKPMPISNIYNKWKSWNKSNRSKAEAGTSRAAARRRNAGPANEERKAPHSKRHVKKRHKKAITKAKKNYGEGSNDHLRATRSKRAASAERVAEPKRRAWSPDAPKLTKEQRQGDRTERRKARRAIKKEHLTSAAVRRTQKHKRNTKDYKGKYFGPDEFKGDQKKINKWKMAGKPKNKSKFV